MENRMNVLMLNGSPRTNGNIALAFQEMEQVFRENGIGVENIQLGKPTNASLTILSTSWPKSSKPRTGWSSVPRCTSVPPTAP